MTLGLDLETGQTVSFGLAMMSLGVWFGSRITGQLAYQEQMVSVDGVGLVTEQPDWVATVQSINQAVLAIFIVSMLAVLLADYYSREDSERPTLESIGLRSD